MKTPTLHPLMEEFDEVFDAAEASFAAKHPVTCKVCERWVATSSKQHRIRLRNMAEHPQVQVHACTACGGTDWASKPPRFPDPPSPRWLAWLWGK